MSTPVVISDAKQWSGQFDCSGPCRRKRLVGAEFSKKALERYRKGGGAIKCKQCVAAVEEAERKAARERAEARTAACAGRSTDDANVGKDAPPVACASCRQSLPTSSFNRNQLSKPPGKARCRSCVEKAVEQEASASKDAREKKIAQAKDDIAAAKKRGDVAAKLAAESVLSALEAEVVTGLKPVALGKGRGRGGRWSSGRGRGGRGRG